MFWKARSTLQRHRDAATEQGEAPYSHATKSLRMLVAGPGLDPGPVTNEPDPYPSRSDTFTGSRTPVERVLGSKCFPLIPP